MEHKTIEGPKGLPILGNLRDFSSDDRINQLEAWREEYGDIIHLKLLGRDAYMLTNPDDVYRVLVKDAKKLHKSPLVKRGLERAIGEGILLSEDDLHKRQRHLTQPAFHMQRISSYADTIVAYGRRMVAGWQDGEQVDINEEMMTVTMQIIGKVLFDADVSDDAHDLGEAITVGIEAAMDKIRHVITLPTWIPTKKNRRHNGAFELLDKTIDEIIEARRATMEDKGDLLSMLLLSVDEAGERMNDKQVRDEAMTLFLAGHETTANALTWTLYLLAQHPEIIEKLTDEIDRVLGDRPATMADLRQLPYTEMVLKEGMRLYPPAWILTRLVMEPIEFERFTAEPNSILMVSQYLTHRDPAIWDDPLVFDPERFTPEAEKERHKYAYFPFGGGPRVCIGNSFAMMEGQLLLATILQQHTVELIPDQEVVPQPMITLRPRDGIQMILRERIRERAI